MRLPEKYGRILTSGLEDSLSLVALALSLQTHLIHLALKYLIPT